MLQESIDNYKIHYIKWLFMIYKVSSLLMLFLISAWADNYGQVVGNNVRVRLKSNIKSPIIHECKKDYVVTILSDEGDYYRIRATEERPLYVYSRFVSEKNTSDLTAKIDGTNVNVRLGPNRESAAVLKLNSQDIKLWPTQEHKKWVAIQPTKDLYYFIAKQYVRKITNEQALPLLKNNQKQFKENLPIKSVKKKIEKNKSVYESNYQYPSYVRKQFSNSEEKLFNEWRQKNVGSYDDFKKNMDVSSYLLADVTVKKIQMIGKHHPGDYLLYRGSRPVAYAYSIDLNLQTKIGSKQTFVVVDRPNKKWGLPAVCILRSSQL